MQVLLHNPGALAFLVLGGVVLYLFLTLRLIRKNARLLWIPALVVAILATMLYWHAFGVTGVGSWFSRMVLAVSTALDLFLFKAFCSLGVAPYFFPSTGSTPDEAAVVTSHLILLDGLFLCAVWTTSILIVHLFARRFSSRLWLAFHKPSGKESHVFFGDDPQSLSLAADLVRKQDGLIIFVLFPSADALPAKLSFAQFFRGVSAGTGRYRRIRQQVPGAVILSARTPLNQCPGEDLTGELGLSGLSRWVQDSRTALYMLSDDFAGNLFILQSLPETPARIFCRADRSGMSDSIELASNRHVRLIDRTFLTVKQMKTDPSFHPVHFVERALDGQGQAEGWVKGGFRSLILGFGETGRGVLDFLYEFGAFVGRDKKQIPFLCEVIDRDASALAGSFSLEHPGIPAGRVRFHPYEIGSEAFWNHLSEALPALNYISVSLGDDQLNVRLALDILELVCRKHNGNHPAVVVRLDDPKKYGRIIETYASGLQQNTVRILGGADLWTVDNLIDEAFERDAARFYAAYSRALGDGTSWEERRAAIEETDHSPFWKKREYRRKIGQDYSDYMHMRVKAELCPERFRQDPAVAETIPAVYEGSHCSDPACRSVLEYLAIGEHLRWLAAHEAGGYRFGTEKREDLKIHPAMKDYLSLDEQTRHYDWIVVKTTLRLLHGEAGSNTRV